MRERVGNFGVDERVALMRAYVGERRNRRHKPGRAFERSFYRFDVLSDYGAFRDMQRHRMLTIEWQKLTPNQRSCIVLKILEGKSYKEISAITGLSVSNVGFQIHDGLKRLSAFVGGTRKGGGRNGM